jgi:hypothetical protein
MLSGDNNDSEPILEWSNDMIKRVTPLPTGTHTPILTPLFFALDHVNYSKWVSVHICDMKN